MSTNTMVAEATGTSEAEVFKVAERAIYTVVVPATFEREEEEEDEQRAERYFLEVGVHSLDVTVEDRDVYRIEPRDGAGDCVACERGVCGPDCPLEWARRGEDPHPGGGREVRVLVVYSNDDFWVVADGRIASIFYGDEFRESEALNHRRLAGLYEAVGLRPHVRVLDLTERLDRMVFGPDGEMLDFSCESEALESLLPAEVDELWAQAVDPAAAEEEPV